jgi:hypothetical protein
MTWKEKAGAQVFNLCGQRSSRALTANHPYKSRTLSFLFRASAEQPTNENVIGSAGARNGVEPSGETTPANAGPAGSRRRYRATIPF